MITELRIGNARLFEGDQWTFPIGTLTIICGTNSAGKSTVIKCLLLLKHAILSREASPAQQKGSKLRLSGGPAELGSFRSFISHNDTERELRLGITIEASMDGTGLVRSSRQLTLLGAEDVATDEMPYIEYELSADFYFGRQTESGRSDIAAAGQSVIADDIQSSSGGSSDGYAILKRAQFKIKHDDAVLLSFEVLSETGSNGSHTGYFMRLPKTYVQSLPELESIDISDSTKDHIDLQTSLRGLLPARLTARTKADESSSIRNYPLPSHIEEVLQDLQTSLFQVSYLGPLRAPAQRYYPGQVEMAADSDVTGEGLPYILSNRLNDIVLSATPDAQKAERLPLAVALNSWLYYLRTGKVSENSETCQNELMVSSVHDVLVSLGIKSPDGRESHGLADSGFGYSQVLPILVKGLMMRQGSLLLIEQPEVHLNPALQVRVGDFLAAMASLNKQIVIETHSEHLVNAIRAESAEEFLREALEKDLSQVAIGARYMILYLDNIGGSARLHKLNIQNDGRVPDWPASFFGESANLLARIIKAQASARSHR